MSIVPWQADKCDPKLKEQGCQPTCSSNHCTSFQASYAYQENCKVTGRTYAPVSTFECNNANTHETLNVPIDQLLTKCQEKHAADPAWNLTTCYCCCWCFARGTLIGVPEGFTKIEKILKGDNIVAAEVNIEGKDVKLNWNPVKIEFARGAENTHEPAMVFLFYGEEKNIICTTDQVFMLSDGKLTTAGKLMPNDELIDKDGQAVPIHTVSIGHFNGGVYHIGTKLQFDGNVDNHLLLAAGVVAGDYTLQIHFSELDDKYKAYNHDNLPHLGTENYENKNDNLIVSKHDWVYSTIKNMKIKHKQFTSYSRSYAPIPFGAQSFITSNQASDILKNGEQRPVSDPIGYSQVANLIKLFKGFYPDVLCHLEWGMNEPNVWAFEQYGEKIIIISGGLVRMRGLFFDGLAMAIAHGISCFYGGKPQLENGFSCVAQADYYAYGVVSHNIWYGQAWGGSILSAMNEIETLLRLISDENAKGNPLDICSNPSIECRIKTIKSAVPGGSLPECAGGPKIPDLMLEAVSADKNKLKLTFSQALTKESADNISNYILTPTGEISMAELDDEYSFIVNLTTKLSPGKYKIETSGLVSIYNTRLDPNFSSDTFEIN
jgi:hypothetical protein